MSFFTPYDNRGKLTNFFENQVILDTISKADREYFGVVSHKLSTKMWNYPFTRHGVKFDQGWLERNLNDWDIVFLSRNNSSNFLQSAENWHSRKSKYSFLDTLGLIFEAAGFPFNTRVKIKHPVYHNHFVARTEIYERYVAELLAPAMKAMSEDSELQKRCMEDSGYTSISKQVLPPEAQAELEVNYFTMHTFLCERFFSCWLQDKRYKIEML